MRERSPRRRCLGRQIRCFQYRIGGTDETFRLAVLHIENMGLGNTPSTALRGGVGQRRDRPQQFLRVVTPWVDRFGRETRTSLYRLRQYLHQFVRRP